MSYLSLLLFKTDPAFQRLLANEKVVAKQEFLSALDTFQRQMPVASYALTGLRADADVLLWVSAPSPEAVQAMAFRLGSSGMGKYLLPARSLLARPLHPAKPGGMKHLFVRIVPEAGTSAEALIKAADRHPGLRLHAADASGFSAAGLILLCEAEDPKDYFKALPELGGPGESFAAVAKEVRDLVDCIG